MHPIHSKLLATAMSRPLLVELVQDAKGLGVSLEDMVLVARGEAPLADLAGQTIEAIRNAWKRDVDRIQAAAVLRQLSWPPRCPECREIAEPGSVNMLGKCTACECTMCGVCLADCPACALIATQKQLDEHDAAHEALCVDGDDRAIEEQARRKAEAAALEAQQKTKADPKTAS